MQGPGRISRADTLSDVGGASLAHAAAFNGEQNVYLLRIPNELVSPEAATGDHAARKNRYLSINPATNGSSTVAVEVRLSSMKRCNGDLSRSCRDNLDCADATGPRVEHATVGSVLGWPSEPDEQGLVTVVDTPVFRIWPEDLVYIGDCEIVPVATYELRATIHGTVFSDPLEVATIRKSLSQKVWHEFVTRVFHRLKPVPQGVMG